MTVYIKDAEMVQYLVSIPLIAGKQGFVGRNQFEKLNR